MGKNTKMIIAGAAVVAGIYLCNKQGVFDSFKKKTTDTNETTEKQEGVGRLYKSEQITQEEMNAVYNRRTF